MILMYYLYDINVIICMIIRVYYLHDINVSHV